MTDREKLIELITEFQQSIVVGCRDDFGVTFIQTNNDALADHLLSNGVTFATDTNVGSKWIPVSERYPTKEDANEFDEVLAVLVNGKRTTYPYYMVNSRSNTFLCWMPLSVLPEPPKEE